jgi:hypothetical protein
VTLRRPLVALALAALVAVPVSASGAGVATTLGLTSMANNIPCAPADGSHPTMIESPASAGASAYTVPSAGVITSFSTWQLDGASVRGLVLRPTGATSYSLVGKSGTATSTGVQELTLPVRIAVVPGDLLALQDLSPSGTQTHCFLAVTSTYTSASVPATTFDPETDAAADFSAATTQNNFAVNVAAQLEPDADGDGYGDVTQDGCPSSAAQQTTCPAAPAHAKPDTTLTGKVKKKVAKSKVTLKFGSATAGARFVCQVDKKAAKACTSPFKHRYPTGKHKVTITATDPATGLSDPTPLVVKFKVVRPKR